MKTFPSMYKEIFMPVLKMHGYKYRSSIFYRETENMIFIIHANSNAHRVPPENHYLRMFFDIKPYCDDLEKYDYDPRIDSEEWSHILPVIKPEKFKDFRFAQHFLANTYRLDALYEESISKDVLRQARDELFAEVFARMEAITDLETYYKTYITICAKFAKSKEEDFFRNEALHNVCIKLHKYENALVYPDIELANLDMQKKSVEDTINKLQTGSVDIKTMLLPRGLRRNDKNVVEKYIAIEEEVIEEIDEKISFWQRKKDALRARDTAYLDKFIAETEARTHTYLSKFFDLKGG